MNLSKQTKVCTMSTTYKITTDLPYFNLTGFAGGEGKGYCLNISQYVSYDVQHSCKYTYEEVLNLKQDMIDFIRNNKNIDNDCFMLDDTFTLEKQHVKTLITDLHIYLNQDIHK